MERLPQRQIPARTIATTCRESYLWWRRRWQLLDAVAQLQVQFAVDDLCLDEVAGLVGGIEQPFRQQIFDQALNGATQWTRTHLRVKTFFDQEVLRHLRHNQFQLLFGQLGTDALEQQLDDDVHLLHAQGMEDDDLVDTVEELGLEGIL